MKKAIVLLSGGLDSATTLYWAKAKGYRTRCLIFDYGQRHKKEIRQAVALARASGSDGQVLRISFPWKGSSLLDAKKALPSRRSRDDIPSTYVPARNIIFLSFAASYAEAEGAQTVFIGANALDYSGYPDCRPGFYKAYQQALKQGLKTGVQGDPVRIKTPLLYKTKAQIVRLGAKLKVPFALTWSCYKGGRHPCGKCDSCLFRRKGFKEAGLEDPLVSKA